MWFWLGVALATPLEDGLAGFQAREAGAEGAPALDVVVALAEKAGVFELAADAVLAAEPAEGEFSGGTAFAVGMRYWRQGDGERANHWFEQVPETSGSWPLAALLRARSKRRGDSLKAAITLCREILEWGGPADPTVLRASRELAIIELGSIYEKVEYERAIKYYALLPEGANFAALAQARIAYLTMSHGSARAAQKVLDKSPSGAWFPEFAAIRAEVAAAKCSKRTTELPAAVQDGLEQVRAHARLIGNVSHPDLLPRGRVDLRIAGDLDRLFAEVATVRRWGSSELVEQYAADLELNSELWLQVQVGLESDRTDRALARVEAAAAACGGER